MANDIVVTTDGEALVEEHEWGRLVWHAGGTVGNCAEMTVGMCVLKPGCDNPMHRHPNCAEVLTVVKGRIRHTGPDGAEVEMNAGDTVVIPAGIVHRARNIGDEDAVLQIAFSSGDRRFERA